ncbi:MAG: flavodoxin-dependent (E)-4-hydroxy-3-methylbut-2-enyl-diphosphate synthase [Pseudomonadota bacterium]
MTVPAYRRITRRPCRSIWIGGLQVGADAPIAIEAASRLPATAAGIAETVAEIRSLEAAGADVVCLPFPNEACGEVFRQIAPAATLPLVADIGSCDVKRAVAAIEAGACSLWLAAGSLDREPTLGALVEVARDHGCSLGLLVGNDKAAPFEPHPTMTRSQGLARTAREQVCRLEDLGFFDFQIALDTPDWRMAVEAARALARSGEHPLALGFGAAGSRQNWLVATSTGLGLLLSAGIGDLIRLAPSADPVGEVRGAVEILKTLGLRRRGVAITADPAFTHARPDAGTILTALEERVSHVSHSIAVVLTGIGPAGRDGLPIAESADAAADPDPDGHYRLHVRGSVGADVPSASLIDHLTDLIEHEVAAIEARTLDRLVTELRHRGRGDERARGAHVGLPFAEVAVALHHVFRGHNARVVWGTEEGDTFHARLTGRRDSWYLPRRRPRASDDRAGAQDPSNAAVAISTALGLAIADRVAGRPSHIIAVIDRAALDAGVTYEAIRIAGETNARLLIVLVDGGPAEEVLLAGVSGHFSRLVSSWSYLALRDLSKRIVRYLPGPSYALAKRVEEYARGLATGGTLFEELGLYHVGPVPGRKLDQLLPVLKNLRDAGHDGPILLHVMAEGGESPAPRAGGDTPAAPPATRAVARGLIAAAEADPRMVAILCSAAEDGVSPFSNIYPQRFFRIRPAAALHGVSLARGLAGGGLRPFLLLDRRTFWRAAGETARELVRLRLPVRFIVDLSLGQADEPWFDAPPLDLSAVPGFVVMVPADDQELLHMLATAGTFADQPILIGHQSSAVDAVTLTAGTTLDIGRGRIVLNGADIAILAMGRGLAAAIAAADDLARGGIAATVADARFAQPLDEALVHALALRHPGLIVLDDPVMATGLAGAVVKALAAAGALDRGLKIRIVRVGRRAAHDALTAAAEVLGRGWRNPTPANR